MTIFHPTGTYRFLPGSRFSNVKLRNAPSGGEVGEKLTQGQKEHISPCRAPIIQQIDNQTPADPLPAGTNRTETRIVPAPEADLAFDTSCAHQAGAAESQSVSLAGMSIRMRSHILGMLAASRAMTPDHVRHSHLDPALPIQGSPKPTLPGHRHGGRAAPGHAGAGAALFSRSACSVA